MAYGRPYGGEIFRYGLVPLEAYLSTWPLVAPLVVVVLVGGERYRYYRTHRTCGPGNRETGNGKVLTLFDFLD